VITLDLAHALRDAGLVWTATRGDRFVVADRDMDDDVFVVSDMTIEVHQHGPDRYLGFNGTSEWALDSVEQDHALWLPREDQLRELLAAAFARLEVVPGGFAAVLTDGSRHVDLDAERAYARALLAVLAIR
jgi:hypothetical protein